MKKKCRFCDTELTHTFCDLGLSPLSNSYLAAEQLSQMEPFYPLHTYVCDNCFLVQLEEFESPSEIFSNYAYFSSFSESWLEHAKEYVRKMINRLGLTRQSSVIEIASNDGYLLQYFKQNDIPVLGIEPAENVAIEAKKKGIRTLVKFFGRDTAGELVAEGVTADLLLGNNVLAHVPDINDFVGGMKILLDVNGVITMEFPHLLRLMQYNQFDTIYHEHFSYLSLTTVSRVFSANGLRVFDVDELSTHGGSIRIYACHDNNQQNSTTKTVRDLLRLEDKEALNSVEAYTEFAESVQTCKWALLEFLINAKREGKSIVGYGAPAKGNTLLNYCGIRTDFIEYTVDRSPHKQGKFLPGTHIPVLDPEKIKETRPDYLLILPWNLKDEIMEQMSFIREWGGKFVIPIPAVEVVG